MLTDNTPVLAQYNPVSIDLNVHRPADRRSLDGVKVGVDPDEARLGHRC